MSRFLLAAAVAACLVASPAAAQPFEAFQQFCLDTGGEPAAARAAAEAAGWGLDPRGASQAGMTLLSHPDGEEQGLMLLAVVPAREAGIAATTCSVLVIGPQSDFISEVEAWTGFEGGRTSRGTPAWVFLRGADGLTNLPDLVTASGEEMAAAARSRGVIHAVSIRDGDAGRLLIYAVMQP